MGFVEGLLETDPNKRVGVVGACELGWILMEDMGIRIGIRWTILCWLGWMVARKKRTALEEVSNGDRVGSDSGEGIINVGNDGRSNRMEIVTTASSSSLAVHQSIATSNDDHGIRSRDTSSIYSPVVQTCQPSLGTLTTVYQQPHRYLRQHLHPNHQSPTISPSV